jgi:acyl-coenzyme A thioesterase PaaI-like protein
VFHVEGDTASPTPIARGPWSASAQHGGAPAALLARTLERCDPGPADFVARLTIELLRPVPLVPLTVAARTTRPGKKVQLVEATLSADGVEVARATALRLRTAELALPVPERERRAFPGPEESPGFAISFSADDERDGAVMPEGFWNAMDVRLATGSWVEAGPSAVWFRLRIPVVAGEEPSPLQRVAAAADFGNGVSAALERGRYLFINPDLTIYLHRQPTGEWVGLDARTHAEANGVGLAESALHDEGGRIGRSLQSLLVDRL